MPNKLIPFLSLCFLQQCTGTDRYDSGLIYSILCVHPVLISDGIIRRPSVSQVLWSGVALMTSTVRSAPLIIGHVLLRSRSRMKIRILSLISGEKLTPPKKFLLAMLSFHRST